jgi:hypothetical protein
MQKVSHTIRVNAEDLERWKKSAKSAGINNLSEWMRQVLNRFSRLPVEACMIVLPELADRYKRRKSFS